jgi:hypothetical protein
MQFVKVDVWAMSDSAFEKLQARLVQEQQYITIINTPEHPCKSNCVVHLINVQTCAQRPALLQRIQELRGRWLDGT